MVYEEKLNNYQLDVFRECMGKTNGGMSVPMGGGKTLISLVLALNKVRDSERILVICAKTLLPSWVNEIEKHFSSSLPYLVYHKDYIRNMDSFILPSAREKKVIITTPEIVGKAYKQFNVERLFIRRRIVNEGQFNQHEILDYYVPQEKPLLEHDRGIGELHSKRWGFIIMDEAHQYNKIGTDRTNGIASLFAYNKWCLSGTLFDEPDPERILGYYLFINDRRFPNNLPDATAHIRSNDYSGLDTTLVKRTEEIVQIKKNEIIVNVEFNPDEQRIYLFMKEIILSINKMVREFKLRKDKDSVRKFNAHLLAMLTYLRQCIVSPLIPLANIAIDLTNMAEDTELSNFFIEQMQSNELINYLSDERNITSSRLQAVLNCVKKHKKMVIFTAFRTVVNLLTELIREKDGIPTLTIDGNMSGKKRSEILSIFEASEECALILTYEIGSDGLNLQCADTVILVDFLWTDGCTRQALSRILRFGQKAEYVNIYYITSNTGVEKAVLNKQKQKKVLLDELSIGAMKGEVEKIKVKDIITILENEENVNILRDIRHL
jgi:SNF2 family DNA or RNA helicase